jgi:hypothetical protein
MPSPTEEHKLRCHLVGALSLCLALLIAHQRPSPQSPFDLTRSTGEVVLGHWPTAPSS